MSILDDDGGGDDDADDDDGDDDGDHGDGDDDDGDDDDDVEVSRSDAWGVARSDAPDVSRSDAYALKLGGFPSNSADVNPGQMNLWLTKNRSHSEDSVCLLSLAVSIFNQRNQGPCFGSFHDFVRCDEAQLSKSSSQTLM